MQVRREQLTQLRIASQRFIPAYAVDHVKVLSESTPFHDVRSVATGAVVPRKLPGQAGWFTVGVLVYKMQPKLSDKIGPFGRWSLSDLYNTGGQLQLFLFGAAFRRHKSLSLDSMSFRGEVFLIQDAEPMPLRDGDTHRSYCVWRSNQVSRIGRAANYNECGWKGCKRWFDLDEVTKRCRHHLHPGT